MKKILLSLSISLLSFFSQAQNTVFDFISNSPDHDTLEMMIAQAGLIDELSEPGSLTVFAPTDQSFSYLESDFFQGLISDSINLSNFLLYHILNYSLVSSEFVNNQELTTLVQRPLYIQVYEVEFEGDTTISYQINDFIGFVTTDSVQNNGVVHVIDWPLFPPPTLYDQIAYNPGLTYFKQVIALTGLQHLYTSQDTITGFAPINASFIDVQFLYGEDSLNSLLNNTQLWTDLIQYHIVQGLYDITYDTELNWLFGTQPIVGGLYVPTIQGSNLYMSIYEDLFYGNAMVNTGVVAGRLTSSNGYLFYISAILSPTFVPITDVNNVQMNEFKFQNPVANNIVIPMNTNSNVQILSTSGQIVYSQNFGGTIDIDTTQLSNGIYLLKVESDNVNQVVKFVK
jgi:uncharacterized surface protein with fasciclin (FAS1) repeats